MHQLVNEKESAPKTYSEGLRYADQRMFGPAIKAFKQCIEMKDINSYRACYELSKVYMKLEDFSSAYDYCFKAIILNPKYIESAYYIAHILNMMQLPEKEFKRRLDSIFYSIPLPHAAIAHIYYMEGFYNTALEYISKCELEKSNSESLNFIKVKCLLLSSRYNECSNYINTFSEDNLYFFRFMMYKVLCLIVTHKNEDIWKVFNKFNESRLSIYNKKVLFVYFQFYNLAINGPTSILCEDESDLVYTEIIFEILDIMLATKNFDCFEKALQLLNLISDKTVLLQLGKLYYKYGYIDLAKKEIIRSIKIFDILDRDSLNILEHINVEK